MQSDEGDKGPDYSQAAQVMGQSPAQRVSGTQQVKGPSQAGGMNNTTFSNVNTYAPNSSVSMGGSPAVGNIDPRQVAEHRPDNRGDGQRDMRFYI